ncbi:hypothetical protein ACWGVP_15615 [Embleya sp. NPDC055612]
MSRPTARTGEYDRDQILGTSGRLELVTVAGEGPWEVSAVPIEGIRTFDRRISGRGSEVVHYTGGERTVILRARRGYGGYVRADALKSQSERAWIFGRFFLGLFGRSFRACDEYLFVASDKRRPWKLRTRKQRWYG